MASRLLFRRIVSLSKTVLHRPTQIIYVRSPQIRSLFSSSKNKTAREGIKEQLKQRKPGGILRWFVSDEPHPTYFRMVVLPFLILFIICKDDDWGFDDSKERFAEILRHATTFRPPPCYIERSTALENLAQTLTPSDQCQPFTILYSAPESGASTLIQHAAMLASSRPRARVLSFRYLDPEDMGKIKMTEGGVVYVNLKDQQFPISAFYEEIGLREPHYWLRKLSKSILGTIMKSESQRSNDRWLEICDKSEREAVGHMMYFLHSAALNIDKRANLDHLPKPSEFPFFDSSELPPTPDQLADISFRDYINLPYLNTPTTYRLDRPPYRPSEAPVIILDGIDGWEKTRPRTLRHLLLFTCLLSYRAHLRFAFGTSSPETLQYIQKEVKPSFYSVHTVPAPSSEDVSKYIDCRLADLKESDPYKASMAKQIVEGNLAASGYRFGFAQKLVDQMLGSNRV